MKIIRSNKFQINFLITLKCILSNRVKSNEKLQTEPDLLSLYGI